MHSQLAIPSILVINTDWHLSATHGNLHHLQQLGMISPDLHFGHHTLRLISALGPRCNQLLQSKTLRSA